MSQEKDIKIDEEILLIFKDLEEKAKITNPQLLTDIKSFNENHVAIESYQNYIDTLNQSPILTTSNSVS